MKHKPAPQEGVADHVADQLGEQGKHSFADLGLGKELLADLAALGYEEPTPI
ncbi:MAG: hypothetical protein O2973_12910 [Gemmatimonadetes bacterium]|nr:hypothetical protein [Gemmatimonadota bacterium]